MPFSVERKGMLWYKETQVLNIELNAGKEYLRKIRGCCIVDNNAW